VSAYCLCAVHMNASLVVTTTLKLAHVYNIA